MKHFKVTVQRQGMPEQVLDAQANTAIGSISKAKGQLKFGLSDYAHQHWLSAREVK